MTPDAKPSGRADSPASAFGLLPLGLVSGSNPAEFRLCTAQTGTAYTLPSTVTSGRSDTHTPKSPVPPPAFLNGDPEAKGLEMSCGPMPMMFACPSPRGHASRSIFSHTRIAYCNCTRLVVSTLASGSMMSSSSVSPP